MKGFVHQEMENFQFVITQFLYHLLKRAKVILLLSSKSKLCPHHQKMNLFNMSRIQVMDQLLTLPRLHLLTFLHLRLLALSQVNLALTPTGSPFWLKVCMSMCQDLQMSSTQQITKFNCNSPPLKHSQMRFNTSQRRAFSYSCQKGGERTPCTDCIDWTIAYSKGESITRKKVCIVKWGVFVI